MFCNEVCKKDSEFFQEGGIVPLASPKDSRATSCSTEVLDPIESTGIVKMSIASGLEIILYD